MLVACVPLLQPPGFCVCKAAGPGRVSSPWQGPAEARTPGSTPPQKVGCCSHRDDASEATRTAPSFDPDRPAPCPTPDGDHLPGCPASAGVDRFKWVEPAQSFAQTLPPPDVGSSLPLEFVPPVAVRPVSPDADWPASPPIYLSHCSLVV